MLNLQKSALFMSMCAIKRGKLPPLMQTLSHKDFFKMLKNQAR